MAGKNGIRHKSAAGAFMPDEAGMIPRRFQSVPVSRKHSTADLHAVLSVFARQLPPELLTLTSK
jgi:hypothetical protein